MVLMVNTVIVRIYTRLHRSIRVLLGQTCVRHHVEQLESVFASRNLLIYPRSVKLVTDEQGIVIRTLPVFVNTLPMHSSL